MVEKTVVVNNETGLHARPAAALVQFVKNFDGDVELIKDGKTANAKSMALGISKGTEVTVRINGENEEENLEKLVEFIENLAD